MTAPRIDARPAAASPPPVLRASGIKVHFRVREGVVRAVDGVSFAVGAGETFALVGESGCGKSTIGRAVMRLTDCDDGQVELCGIDITHLPRHRLKPHRRHMQMVFQDPYASLNPRLKAGRIVGEPFGNFGLAARGEREAAVAALFRRVGLPAEAMDKYPHEFSGGQRQRLGIARALALKPAIIIADEPVSALDVSVQAQVLNLMRDLQEEFGLAFLFISHDMAVVEHVSHRVAVMYLGRIVELADKTAIFAEALHPYTEALLRSVPSPDPEAAVRAKPLGGEVPSPLDPPAGCHFHPRCPFAEARCRTETPALREVRPGHHVACHIR